jgi:hypothetical protein
VGVRAVVHLELPITAKATTPCFTTWSNSLDRTLKEEKEDDSETE